MQISQASMDGARKMEFDGWTEPGTPVSLAYDRGYADAIKFAVVEIARLRLEIEALKKPATAH